MLLLWDIYKKYSTVKADECNRGSEVSGFWAVINTSEKETIIVEFEVALSCRQMELFHGQFVSLSSNTAQCELLLHKSWLRLDWFSLKCHLIAPGFMTKNEAGDLFPVIYSCIAK